MNLRAGVDARRDVDSRWVVVDYSPTTEWWERLPSMPVRLTLRGRRQVATGSRSRHRGRQRRSTPRFPRRSDRRSCRPEPYVLCSDVTPRSSTSRRRRVRASARSNGVVRWAKFRWNRRVLQRAAAHAPWSQWVANSLTTDYAVDPQRIEVIPPGVDTTLWTPADRTGDSVNVLFVGGDFVARVATCSWTLSPRFRAAVLSCDWSPAHRFPTPGVTVFNGLEPNGGELRDLYRTSDVFVLPSRSETFGIAAIEAVQPACRWSCRRSGIAS